MNQDQNPHNDEIPEDLTDSELFKSNPKLTKQSQCLQFYVDEFEVVNPLGSKKGTYKMTTVYLRLGNLDHKDTSRLQNIYLSTLIHHCVIQKQVNTYEEVFKPLIHDIQELKTKAMKLSCNGENKTFQGTITTISADNLSAHAVIGLSKKCVASAWLPRRTFAQKSLKRNSLCMTQTTTSTICRPWKKI